MLPKSNVHSHTTFSDGKNSAEEMIQTAIQRGFVSLGFSDHGYAPFELWSMSLEQEARYRREIPLLAQKYASQIEIAMGYEHDYHMPETDLSPYDYVIESVHMFHRQGEYAPIDESPASLQGAIDQLFMGDPYIMCSDYFNTLCLSIMDTPAQIIGHVGLITKFNEGNRMFNAEDRRYLRPAREALRLAVERDLLVEVNTGAVARGYCSTPYPGKTLLKNLCEMGGRVILTSDCHSAETIDFAFDSALELIRASGFKEVWGYAHGDFQPYSIVE